MNEGAVCSASTTLDVAECAKLSLCLTAPPAMHVDSASCTGCSWGFQVNVGDTLTFENEQGWVFLRFSSIAGLTTTEEFAAALQHATLYAKFPLKGSTSPAAAFVELPTSADFDVFEVVDGRLHVKIAFDYRAPYSSVLASNKFCGDTNLCFCYFHTVAGSTEFELDLPIEQY